MIDGTDSDNETVPAVRVFDDEDVLLLTGLPWPRTWRGAYIVVVCTLVLWIALLTALTGHSS